MFVYFHRNPVTYDIFYVGVGTRKSRAFDFNSGRNPYYMSYVAKHGTPVVQIVCKDLTKEQAHEKEKFYIKLLGRKRRGGGQLVNLSEGGDPTPILPEESRKRSIAALVKWNKENPDKNSMKNPLVAAKLSGENNSSKRPEVREKLRLANIGKKHSAESKIKMRLLKLGKPSTQPKGYRHSSEVVERMRIINKEITNRPEVREKLRQQRLGIRKESNFVGVNMIEKNTNQVLKIFPSITDALLFLGKNIRCANITSVCRGKRNIAHGYKWQYT